MRKRAFSITNSPAYKKILDLYANRGDKTKYEIYLEACKLDHDLNNKKASFYRWAKSQDEQVEQLESRMTQSLAVNLLEDKIDRRRLIRLAKEVGMEQLVELQKLAQRDDITVKERITIANLALQASKLEQSDDELALNDVHHSEELDIKKEMMNAASRPQIIVEDRREG